MHKLEFKQGLIINQISDFILTTLGCIFHHVDIQWTAPILFESRLPWRTKFKFALIHTCDCLE